ncbi:MAG: hypothetical protein ACYCW6_18625 [Candidatus Xenobia bacterium]
MKRRFWRPPVPQNDYLLYGANPRYNSVPLPPGAGNHLLNRLRDQGYEVLQIPDSGPRVPVPMPQNPAGSVPAYPPMYPSMPGMPVQPPVPMPGGPLPPPGPYNPQGGPNNPQW